MDATASQNHAPQSHPIQQRIKWTVYTLLLVNFGFYIYLDISNASHTLHEGSTLLEITSAFSISTALLAWFGLLAMYELDTYLLDEEKTPQWVWPTVRWIRIICAVIILHWGFAMFKYAVDIWPDKPVEGVSDLCELVGQDMSFTSNLEYTEITGETCTGLSEGDGIFPAGQ